MLLNCKFACWPQNPAPNPAAFDLHDSEERSSDACHIHLHIKLHLLKLTLLSFACVIGSQQFLVGRLTKMFTRLLHGFS